MSPTPGAGFAFFRYAALRFPDGVTPTRHAWLWWAWHAMHEAQS